MRAFVFIFIVLLFSCKAKKEDLYFWKELQVKVSAYNSLPNQTWGNPEVAAWGDTLTHDMYAVAVSRDLLKLGLDRNTPIKIAGLDSIYWVKDKMHYRWRNRIDIFMGKDLKKAKKWGVKKKKIWYGVLKDSLVGKE